MNLSRFCTFSGEDFCCEKHEFVEGGSKVYINCKSATFPPCNSIIKRFVGYFGNNSLIAINKLNENVCNLCLCCSF
jgi:hypothetical protein